MNFARGFVSDPEVLFLDEPTLGMDVNAARDLRAYVADWVRERDAERARTVLLTTHYMAEADELCDRIAIIDRGRVLACDTPAGAAPVGAGRAARRARGAAPPGAALEPAALDGVRARVGRAAPRARHAHAQVPAAARAARWSRCCARWSSAGARVRGVSTRETSLEDVFIAIVGPRRSTTGRRRARRDDERHALRGARERQLARAWRATCGGARYVARVRAASARRASPSGSSRTRCSRTSACARSCCSTARSARRSRSRRWR